MKKSLVSIGVCSIIFGMNAQVTELPNGNVGIGETNPKSSLHISSPITSITSTEAIDANLVIEGKNNGRTTDKGASLGFVIPANTDGTNQWQQGRILVAPANNSSYNAAGKMYLQTRDLNSQGNAWEWKDNLVLEPSGNVGVGTADTKGYKLAVAGKMVTEEVKVDLQTNWPDYIFEADYKLPSLLEVEAHIKEKRHLKDIPSAKEVAENGIFLGKMDAKLLQKIEELTLYTIQQQKEIQKLKEKNTQIEKQQKEIIELKSLLMNLLKSQK